MDKPAHYLTKYNEVSLKELVDNLNDKYYESIYNLCIAAKAQADRIQKLEHTDHPTLYISQCISLCDQLQQFIKMRREIHIPYLHKLDDKDKTGHDCSACNNGCAAQREMMATEMRESLASVKAVLDRMHMAALPLYSETMYPDAYRILRNQVALTENSLTELLFLENTYLVPRVSAKPVKA